MTRSAWKISIMNRLFNFGKTVLENNSNIFSLFRYIPYSMRLGKSYKEHKRLICWYENSSVAERRVFHFDSLKNILDYAYHNIPFYEELYSLHNYHPREFGCLEDFNNVPIINKDDLRKHDLERRSINLPGAIRSNTGGTSGSPLSFNLDDKTFAREWAYMHNIWARLGYNYLDAKLTFRGKNIGEKALMYNVVHNEYIVNAYVDVAHIVESVSNLAKRNPIKYLHGYPSAIYEFCRYLQESGMSTHDLFQGQLIGVFFGSEYPAPQYRNLVEEVLGVPTLSWYGHSECAVLAFETTPFHYNTFPTYGYAEAVKQDNQDEFSLLSTGYYNKASPFIRYDTGDLIKAPCWSDGVLSQFQISSGRTGDFIVDSNNKRISLTALIFGRHHSAFDKVMFIQIRNPAIGRATLVVTTDNDVSMSDFDLSNVDIEFDLETVKVPVKTNTGKTPLLIK